MEGGGGDDKEPHCCRACGKLFPCGRSLCSHMRSHSSFSSEDDGDYEFVRKMTTRDCTTNGGSRVTTPSSSSRTFMELRACLRLPEPAVPRRAATRRRSRRVASIAAASEFDEDEDVALCLIMLSRDSPSKRSFAPALERKGEEEELPAKPKKITGGGESEEKRARFSCPECNKPFPSYQALGGHRANRKRINGGGCCSSKIPDDTFAAAIAPPESAKKARAHRCPICDKVFGSGQALGGHKRSHLMASSTDRNYASRDLLDLNLPAPADDNNDNDDDDDDSSNAKENVECKSWWIEGDHNKHGSLVGFI